MTFSFSFGGVRVSISPSPSSPSSAPSGGEGNFVGVSSVRRCDDGRLEADVSNFTGTIVVSSEESFVGVVDATGEGGRELQQQPRHPPEGSVLKEKNENEMEKKYSGKENDNHNGPEQKSLPWTAGAKLDEGGPARQCPQRSTRTTVSRLTMDGDSSDDDGGNDDDGKGSFAEGERAGRGIVVVDAIPERGGERRRKIVAPPGGFVRGIAKNDDKMERGSSSSTDNSSDPPEEAPEPYVCPIPRQDSQLTVEIDSDDDRAVKIPPPPESFNNSGASKASRVSFDIPDVQAIWEPKPKVDLRLHKMCESEETEISDLRELLKSKPELASAKDEFGDYPAHVFANNDAFIYTSDDDDVRRFVFELYAACPTAFLSEGYAGQIPFAEAIVDWVDDCHSVYDSAPRPSDSSRFTSGSASVDSLNRGSGGSGASEVFRVSEIKALTKSTRVINSLCVREEVQKLVQLPSYVSLPVKVAYSFKMLSFILDTLGQTAFDEISTRHEFLAVASKRRDKIIESVASLPFLIRTIFLIEKKCERDALIDLSIVRNLMFRPESVDLWLVALLSGGERARACASDYLRIVSRLSLSGMFGRRKRWGEDDTKRFEFLRRRLYDAIANLSGFLPCMLHLGDSLYEAGTQRAVKYIVESTVGRPLPVYKKFMEMSLLLILMTSYRIIVELVYAVPSEEFLSQHREFWALSLSAAVYFAHTNIAILLSLSSTEERLARRYATGFGNMVGYVTIASVIAVLSVLHVDGNVMGKNFVGIVSGLLWWKFLLHVKGMSANLSTLIYTMMQIAAELKYFLAVFLIAIFFFADMIDIVKKTSGECDGADENMDLEAFCSLTPLQSYLAMYGVMIGGMEISALEDSSALVSILFVAASFCGVIVFVNILIAIVTREYEKAQARSCVWFARARLEAAAEQVALEKVWNPPDDPASGVGRKIWRTFAKAKYVALLTVVEVYLIESLHSCASLNRDGIVGDFLYVALILCAVLYHMFLVSASMYLFAKYICNTKGMEWLRGSRFHIALFKICLKPVCIYLRSVGLGKNGLNCDDMDEDDRPLSREEFLGRQAILESDIQKALKDTETRLLNALMFGEDAGASPDGG